MRRSPLVLAIPFTLLFRLSPLMAQVSVGTIEASSATISGTTSLNGGTALMGAKAVITARDRTARLALDRGGEVLVCATSALHAARTVGAISPAPLLLALDRGAIEIHMAATASDTILTPDLRFTIAGNTGRPAAGLLDLRIRVGSNGDTCVENRGAGSPTLEVAEQFSAGLYQVHPKQHLLFEHGSLREVVDGETSPCGCPPPPVLSAADSGISTDVTRAARPGARVADDPDEVRPHSPAEAQHPFPAAESQGLTATSPAAAVPQAQPGETHAQVAATLAFGADGTGSDGSGSISGGAPAAPPGASGISGPAPPPGPRPAPSASSTQTAANGTIAPSSQVHDQIADHEIAQSPLPPPAPSPRTLAHRVGHFFRHLFGGS